MLEKEIVEIIDKAQPEIYNIIEGIAREYYEAALENYDGEFVPFEENRGIMRIVEETKREVFESFEDNFELDEIGLIDSEGKFTNVELTYRRFINGAIVEVMT